MVNNIYNRRTGELKGGFPLVRWWIPAEAFENFITIPNKSEFIRKRPTNSCFPPPVEHGKPSGFRDVYAAIRSTAFIRFSDKRRAYARNSAAKHARSKNAVKIQTVVKSETPVSNTTFTYLR